MMKLGRIPDGDSLFRLCVYPIPFNKKSASFAYEKMWHLKIQPDGAYHGSLAWERYAPTIDYVHGYGCRVAAGINERKRVAGKYQEKDRHHYCGAYELRGRAVRTLATTSELGGITSAEIVHQIENGEIAHSDLRIFLTPGIDVEGTKTAIVDRLWNACSGPLRHICDCDKDIPGHQNSNLAAAPIGEYRTRLWHSRVWHITRFQVIRWLWLNSVPPSVESSNTAFYRWWAGIKSQICDWLLRCAFED